MGLRERLLDVARFAMRPTYVAQPMAWGRAAALGLLVMILLNLAVSPLLRVLLEAADHHAGFLPGLVEQPPLRLRDLVGPVIIAPVLEELLFRSWLSGRGADLRFAAYGFAALIFLFADYLLTSGMGGWLALTAVGVVFAGLLHWGMTRQRDTVVPAWFVRHFHWIVWGSTALFGLLHLGNHDIVTSPLGIMVVLPQTMGGLLLAYTRTRFGLGAAIVQHSTFNAIWYGAALVTW